jgi:hypothetical protein
MLRANVGLSRKISRDYQSTGYTVNIDGEIPFSADDPEGVLEKVRELFDLAQEALDREIDRDQGEMAIGRRDESPAARNLETPNRGRQQESGNSTKSTEPSGSGSVATNGSSTQPASDDIATNKQVKFILTMAKKSKLSTSQLDNRIVQIVGRKCGLYELTKKEAGKVLDQMTANAEPNAQKA